MVTLDRQALDGALASAREAASSEGDPVAALLRAADALTAAAVAALARRPVLSVDGLPSEMALSLKARLTGSESRAVVRASGILTSMPRTAAAFSDGVISWGQVRAICSAVRVCSVAQRAGIDASIGREAARLRHSDPDELVRLVDDEVARARADLAVAREDRALAAGFLTIQGSLEGRAVIFGEGDAEAVATIAEAASTAAPAPGCAPTYAQGLFDGLLAVSEAYLAGDPPATGAAPVDRSGADAITHRADNRTRPRPRLLATVQLSDLVASSEAQGAQLLWRLAGAPVRLTRVAIEALSCDAGVIPVIFDGAQPIAVGSETQVVTRVMRRALIARDRGCRFPGCGAPAAWTDAHHIRNRSRGGATEVGNLILLCRRCHRRVHRFRWAISIRDDGSIGFTWRGRTVVSPARAGPARP